MALADIAAGSLAFSAMCGALVMALDASARRRRRRPASAPSATPALIEGWNQIYDHHWLEGEEPDRAVARAERWAARDLRGPHYDVGCDQRLSTDVRERLIELLAAERRLVRPGGA